MGFSFPQKKMKKIRSFLILCFVFIPLFAKLSVSDPRATQAALVCSNRTAPTGERQTFVSNFLAAMDAVTPLMVQHRYAAVVNGTGDTKVYGFGECMKDLDESDCNICFAQCKTQILRCLPFQLGRRGGRLFYDGCYLRYDDYNFFNESLSEGDGTVCSTKDVASSNQTIFKANVMQLVTNLSVEAPKNDGFFVGSVSRGNVSVYGLAQCWELVNNSACKGCLANAVSRISSCPPKQEGRALNAGCYLRYSAEKFYYNSTAPTVAKNGGRRKLAIILAATFSTLALTLIIATSIFCLNKKVMKKKRERKQLGALSPILNKSKLNFSYESLEKATNYFHESNKLGQGGSGSVYKGTLPDGKVVAIKRLFFNTRQWVDHFFNEVNLISGIYHKNLVKLLGCSITGPESLLVYEYVPNHSLHDYLFGVSKDCEPLTYEARYKIILGTAEGLAYLHEESKLRIIHRDIKLSNILLDEDLTAKIADFGLARLFPQDKTHISTGIAGTLGYMAPEYVVRGQLTEKADVYSFGVLVTEVICGKRNKCFTRGSVSILHMVWNHYEADKLCEAVDPIIEDSFREKGARLLLIGLLCAQTSAELRPSMSTVVQMLIDDAYEIHQPTQPPFLNSNSTEVSQNIPSTSRSRPESYSQSSGNSMTQSIIEPR